MMRSNTRHVLGRLRPPAACGLALLCAVSLGQTEPATTQPAADPGASPTLGAKPPAMDDNTIVLFDGVSFDSWRQRDGAPSQWEVQDDGSVLVKGGDAVTSTEFTDFQLHLEFFCPEMPEHEGQARANSGVYVHGRYEIQVLDSFGLEPMGNGCGAIYSIAAPLVNASRPPGTWQTYDIIFRAARFDGEGAKMYPAVVTVLHNGIVIHNNLELPHTTPGGLDREETASGPILLQDHGDPLRYRNIWIRKLD